MILTFKNSVDQSRGDNVYLVQDGIDHSRQSAWYFIHVEAAKTRAFLKAISSGVIDLAIFGEILESGYGKEPPYSVLMHMREHYGYTG